MKLGALVRPERWSHYLDGIGIVVECFPGDVIGVLIRGKTEHFLEGELQLIERTHESR